MQAFLQRLTYGYVALFIGSQSLTGLLLLNETHSILVPAWRAFAGVLILLLITTAVFKRQGCHIIGEGMASGIFLAVISMFFTGLHPMNRFAAVRHLSAEGIIESDNVYLRSAPVVRMLESKGSKKSTQGGTFEIERYLYSPRIGVLLGKLLGDGEGSPDLGYEINGLPAWFFGVRVACEQFVFFAINLTPLLLAYCGYRHWKKKPQRDSLNFDPKSTLFLTGPFVLGLIPFISP